MCGVVTVVTVLAVGVGVVLIVARLLKFMLNPRPSDYDDDAIKRYNIQRMRDQIKKGK